MQVAWNVVLPTSFSPNKLSKHHHHHQQQQQQQQPQ
jgi:hypothetical protein